MPKVQNCRTNYNKGIAIALHIALHSRPKGRIDARSWKTGLICRGKGRTETELTMFCYCKLELEHGKVII